MSVVRRVLFPLFGLGHYDYGIMRYRYPMQFAQHASPFLVRGGSDLRIRFLPRGTRPPSSVADLEARLAEAQLQDLQLQLQPHFLFNALIYHFVTTMSAVLTRCWHDSAICSGAHCRQDIPQEVPLEQELALVKSYIAIDWRSDLETIYGLNS